MRHVARHDALQTDGDLRRSQRGIDAGLGPRAMGALAGDADVEEGAAGHHRPGTHRKAAHLQAGPVVHAEDRFAREALEQAVVDHRLRAAQAFFGRLEDEVHHAVETPRGRQVARRAQQHRGVAVVAAGMHYALVHRAMAEAVDFQDRQRVHVGAQANRPRAAAGTQHADHAGAADAAMNLVEAKGIELGRHQARGAVFLEAQLRVGMDVLPPRRHLGMQRGEQFDGGHESGFLGWLLEAPGDQPRVQPSSKRRGTGFAGPLALPP
jgi:hypothetical protein